MSRSIDRRAVLRAFVGSACFAAAHTPANARADDSLSGLVARIAKAREGLRSLRGPFTQTRTIGLLATDVVSHGTLTLLRPDRLRWDLEAPDSVTFWVGPEGVAYRSEHGEGRLPAATARMADALDDLRTLLGGDLVALTTRWLLRVERDDPNGCQIEATARTPQSGIARRIELTLAADLIRPTIVLLEDGPRDRTAIQFGELHVNVPVDARSMKP